MLVRVQHCPLHWINMEPKTCPHSTCGHTWTPRKADPKKCPQCRQFVSDEARDERRAYDRLYKRSLTPEQKAERIKYNRTYYRAMTAEMRDRENKGQRRRAKLRTAEQKRRRSLASCEWAKRNPDKARARNHTRKARVRGVGGSYTERQWLDLVAKCNHRCLKCGLQEPEIKLTVDHIVPISKGGPNTIDNIQPLCLRCNLEKRDKTVNYLTSEAA